MNTPKKSNMKSIIYNENKKDEETSRTTNKYNDTNINQRQTLRYKNKKNSFVNRERDKRRNSLSRSKSKRKSINGKNKMSDDKNKIRNNINNLKVETERDNSSKTIKKIRN